MFEIDFLKNILNQVKICPVRNKEGEIRHYKIKWKVNPSITEEQEMSVKQVMRLVQNGTRQSDIAKILGISQSQVSKLLKKGILNNDGVAAKEGSCL
jgi:DNA invertase Pin-like site-specific DNA recombinase